MNALYQRAAGVATAKVAEMRVRTAWQARARGGAHGHVVGPGGHAPDGARAHMANHCHLGLCQAVLLCR
jgi:hypothetical protein